MFSQEFGDAHNVTIGDLCRALDEGQIPARVREGAYEVRWADVRRLGAQGEHADRRRERQQQTRRRPAS